MGRLTGYEKIALALTAVFLVICAGMFWLGNREAGIYKDMGRWTVGALDQLLYGLASYAVTCGILFLLYGGAARITSAKSVKQILSHPLAEAVKERE
jgi:hypothetical protein